MFNEFFAIVSRSRRHLAQDAAGVALLFAMLITALHVTAI